MAIEFILYSRIERDLDKEVIRWVGWGEGKEMRKAYDKRGMK